MERDNELSGRKQNEQSYKGTICDENSQYIIQHLSLVLEAADSDILKVTPSKGKRAAVIVYKNGSTLFILAEGDSPLQMIADVVNRCLIKQGVMD